MEANDCINILLIGESGVGKSTLINSLANYIQHESLQAASNSGLVCLIPTVFTLSDDQYKEQIVHLGFNGENVGKSTTDVCNDYVFDIQDIHYPIRFIDTPGVGTSKDEEHIRNITQHIKSYTHINAICFLLQPNVNTLGEYVKYTIETLLKTISKAAPNIIFVFTHSRSTFYKPGETMTILQEFVRSYKIPLTKENMFCLDNEAFRYGVALQHGFRYTKEQFGEFERSWDISGRNLRDMLIYIVERLQPIESKKIAAGKHQNSHASRSVQPLQGAVRKIQIKEECAQTSTSEDRQPQELLDEINTLKERAKNYKDELNDLKRYIKEFKGELDAIKEPVVADNQESFGRVARRPQEDEVTMLRLQNRELLNQREDFVRQIRNMGQSGPREVNAPQNQVFIERVGNIIGRQRNVNIDNNTGNYSGNFSGNNIDLTFQRLPK